MIFLVAGLDPAPPTAMDLQARSTQDLSFASMNSTAVALAKQMLVNIAPSPGRIFLPVTGRETATPGPMAAMTLRPVSDFLSTPTPFSLYKFLFPPTPTRKKSDKPTSTAVHTPVPTKTLRPPTLTATSAQIPTKPPTSTPIPPTPTDIPTDPPTSSPVPPPSSTPSVAPTSTNAPTSTDPPPPTNAPTSTDPPPPTNPPPQPTGTSAPIVVTQPAATQPAATQPADTQPPVTP